MENAAKFKKIVKSYHKSLDDYEIFLKVITGLEDTKKNELFKFKNLKNFRNNSLSYGLDTREGAMKSKKDI